MRDVVGLVVVWPSRDDVRKYLRVRGVSSFGRSCVRWLLLCE